MKKTLAILLVFLLAFSGCVQEKTSETDPGKLINVSFKVTGYTEEVLEITIEAESGSNAFELMKENMRVEYDSYDFGVMVNEIEGIKPEGTDYWALYVNREYAEKGISDYVLNENIILEWKIEANPYA